jgi:hypothetical protein
MALPAVGSQIKMSQVNTELGNSSNAQLKLSTAGNTLASISIGNQVKLSQDLGGTSAATLSVSPTSLSYSWLGHSQSVSITATPSSLTWSTTIFPPAAEDWLSRSPISGTGSGNMSITASKNTGPPRIGTVDITASGVSSVSVSVNQAGGQV